jgi:hypothetical protein
MKFSRKKIFIAAITLFCILGVIVLGLELKQRAAEKSEAIRKEEIKKCVETAGEMNFSEMIDLTEQLSNDRDFRMNEKIDIYAYPYSLLWKHLQCKFSQEQNEEKKNALVDYAMEARRRILYRNLNEVWGKVKETLRENFIQPKETFFYNLAFGNMAEICPDKLSVLCRKDNGVLFLEPDEWCNRICETLAQYEKDKDKLNKEVISFKDWREGIKNFPPSLFIWRLAVAYRFGGENLALKICDNASNTEERNMCRDSEVTMLRNKDLACDAAFEQLAQLICDYKYRND